MVQKIFAEIEWKDTSKNSITQYLSETKKADEQRACAPGACSNRTGRTVAPERIHRSIHPFRPRQLQPTPGRRIFIYGERENRENSLRAHGRRDKFTGNSPVLKTDG